MVHEADLKAPIERLKESVNSTDELLKLANALSQNQEVAAVQVKAAQRNALLDSLRVKRFHKQYKLWDNERRDEFIEKEIRAYNKKYAQMTRLHTELNELEDKYEDTKKSVLLPQFKLSIQTLREYDNGSLLEHVPKDAEGNYPSLVMLDEIFSLDPKSSNPAPDFRTFNRLVNLEFHLRSLSQIKYEVLRRMRSHLTIKNSQWGKRDNSLNQFISRELRERIDEVKKIRAAESHDLRDVDVDFELEEYGEEEEEENEEKDNEEEKEDKDDEEATGEHNAEDGEANGHTQTEENGATPEVQETEQNVENEEINENEDHNENAEDEEMQEKVAEGAEQPTEEKPSEDVTEPKDPEPTDMLID